MSLKTYPWFDQVPENLKTRNQLAELGLRPGGSIKAQVVWKRGQRWANLYDLAEARPKQPATAAQLAALKKAQEKRRTCPVCKAVLPYVMGRYDDCPVCLANERSEELSEVRAQARLWLSDALILDTETTDLDGYIVQIAIIEASGGEVRLDTLVDPREEISEGAQRVHGITAAQLEGQPTFSDLFPLLVELLPKRHVVTYNAAFDSGIFYNELCRANEQWRKNEQWWKNELGLENHSSFQHASPSQYAHAFLNNIRWECAMKLYATWWGDWSEYHGNYKWQRLPGGDHSALGDCRATLALLRRIAEEKDGQA